MSTPGNRRRPQRGNVECDTGF